MWIFLTQIISALLSYGAEDHLYPVKCESCTIKTTFDTNVHVEVSVSYPRIPETGHFAHCVNENLRKEVNELHDLFVQEMNVPETEFWEEEGDTRELRYGLNLVHSSPGLMSFYGSKYEHRGGARGSLVYITKTFWQQADTILELSLDDLFLLGSREWLFRYCEDYFRLNRYGYYNYDDYSVGFNSADPDAFLLTEKGLLLIFQNYVIDGYNDDPMTLLIPYAKLVSIINPAGPLPLISATKAMR